VVLHSLGWAVFTGKRDHLYEPPRKCGVSLDRAGTATMPRNVWSDFKEEVDSWAAIRSSTVAMVWKIVKAEGKKAAKH
jgi:hypothetical protein